MYDAYKQFCQESGILPLPSATVLPRIAQQPGVKKTRTSKGTCYIGVGVYKCESTLFGGAYAKTRSKKRSNIGLDYLDDLFVD